METETRPDKPKSAEAKARLIAAASALMAEKDTVEITLSEIADRSEMNSALVKYHFGNKEGLLFAVLEHDIAGGLAALERLLGRTDLSPVEKMRFHISGLVETYARIPYLHRLIQVLTRDATEERVKWIATRFIDRIARGQQDILREGQRRGQFREVDPMSFYFAVVGAAGCLYSQRFVMKAAFGRDEVDPAAHRRNVDQIVDLLLGGLIAEPKQGEDDGAHGPAS